MRVLGIVAALTSEARTLAVQPMMVGTAVHLKQGSLLKIAGIGGQRARAAADFLLAQGATALVSWGSAGALHPALSPGNLLLPETIIAADRSDLAIDSAWHGRLCHLLTEQVQFNTEALAESKAVLASPADKRAFFSQSGAVAADMESASVAQTAIDAKVPFLAIRAVVDPLKMAIPPSVLASIDEYGRVRPLRLLHGLALNPTKLPLLIQLSRNFHMARTTLAMVARLALDSRFAL